MMTKSCPLSCFLKTMKLQELAQTLHQGTFMIQEKSTLENSKALTLVITDFS